MIALSSAFYLMVSFGSQEELDQFIETLEPFQKQAMQIGITTYGNGDTYFRVRYPEKEEDCKEKQMLKFEDLTKEEQDEYLDEIKKTVLLIQECLVLNNTKVSVALEAFINLTHMILFQEGFSFADFKKMTLTNLNKIEKNWGLEEK